MLRKINKLQVASSKPQALKQIILSILSALLLIASFPKADLGILAWVGFVPLFLALNDCPKKKAFIYAYLAGFIYWLGIIYWIWYVAFFSVFVLAAYLAVYFGIFGLIFSSFSSHRARLVIIPVFWVVLEYCRAHLLTGFGWAMLGYSQYMNLSVIQISDITGVYGVSFFLMSANLFIYNAINSKFIFSKIKNQGIVFILMLIVVFSYGIFRLSVQPEDKKSVKVGVIQGNIAQDLKWRQDLRQEILGKYLSLTKLLAEKNPDLIIWPETSLPYWADKTDGSLKMIEDLLRKATSKPLLLGCVFSSQEEFFNSALFFTKERISNYNKIHLVPFGEYIPLRKKLPVLEMIVNQVVPIADFSFGKEFTVFDFSPKFSVLICFEDTISNLSRNFVKNGARMLVNITNDAWFWDSSSPYQHLQSSVFRAVENHVSLVRSANTGVSCFINDKGKIHAYVQDEFGKKTFIQGVLVGDVSYQENAKLTFYTRYGDIFIFVCFGVAIYVIITKIIKRNKPKRNV